MRRDDVTVTAIDLFSQPVQLPGGSWTLSAFHATSNAEVHADHWEIHDEADEVVSCLDGALHLHLRGDRAGEDDVVALTSGSAVVVPRGRWHRIELDRPSDILAVTVRRGTRHEKRA